jgi:hypothetical protein
VTTPAERRVKGVETRRSRKLDLRDATVHRGIPITTVPRTLVDLSAELGPDDLARACHEAGVLHRTTPGRVEAVLGRRPNAPGAPRLRAVLRGDVQVTLSKLERTFLKRLEDANLPLPETNRPAGGRRVDCRWSDPPLTVELDGYRFHNSRHSWEMDRRREREARRGRDDEFRLYSFADVFEDPSYMLWELRKLLTAPSTGTPASARAADWRTPRAASRSRRRRRRP